MLVGRDGQRYTLHIAGVPPHLLSGSTVALSGVAFDTEVVLADGDPSVTTSGLRILASAPPEAKGEQRTIVLLVSFEDVPLPSSDWYLDSGEASSEIFGAGTRSVDTYYRETSFQQTWLSGRVVGWYKLPTSDDSRHCRSDGMMQAAIQAADPDVYFPEYDHIVLIFPEDLCPWGGLGTIGKVTVSTADGLVTASKAWIENTLSGGVKTETVTHELGHNLGLKVIAEGVEDQAVWDRLKTLGCDSAQGYYMAHPLPPDKFMEWLAQS